jgi:hypothetical protein
VHKIYRNLKKNARFQKKSRSVKFRSKWISCLDVQKLIVWCCRLAGSAGKENMLVLWSCSTRKGESGEMFSRKWLHRLLIHGCPMTHGHWRRRYDMCTPQALVSSKKTNRSIFTLPPRIELSRIVEKEIGRQLSPAHIYIWAKSVLSYANGACEKGPRTRTHGRARVKFQEINQSIRWEYYG